MLTGSPEEIHFFTRWTVNAPEGEKILCHQEVEMQGIEDHVQNGFAFFDWKEGKFQVELKNQLVGQVVGKGVYDETKLAWEFHAEGEIEGFEVYNLQKGGDYHLHAEYTSLDHEFRTIITGRLWRKVN